MIKLIGFTSYYTEHENYAFIGYYRVLIASGAAERNPEAIKHCACTSPSVSRFDNGDWLVAMTIYQDRRSRKFTTMVPSLPANDVDEGQYGSLWYNYLSLGKFVANLINEKITEDFKKNPPRRLLPEDAPQLRLVT
jgi:hypothetical protein